VVEVAHGALTRYPGSYDDYLEAKARGDVPDTAPAPTPSPRPARHAPSVAATSRATGQRDASNPARAAEAASARPTSGAGSRQHAVAGADSALARPGVRLLKKKPSAEVKELRRRVEEVERKIHGLERRIAEIGAALSDPRLYLDGDRVRAVSGERKAAEEEMAELLREWESLSTALSAHE
jgi:hypothetical protein